MIPLLVELGRLLEHITRAVNDAKAAALAAVINDMHDAFGDLDFQSIQWNTPKFHTHLSSIKKKKAALMEEPAPGLPPILTGLGKAGSFHTPRPYSVGKPFKMFLPDGRDAEAS